MCLFVFFSWNLFYFSFINLSNPILSWNLSTDSVEEPPSKFFLLSEKKKTRYKKKMPAYLKRSRKKGEKKKGEKKSGKRKEIGSGLFLYILSEGSEIQ